jgi:hypothetical protein
MLGTFIDIKMASGKEASQVEVLRSFLPPRLDGRETSLSNGKLKGVWALPVSSFLTHFYITLEGAIDSIRVKTELKLPPECQPAEGIKEMQYYEKTNNFMHEDIIAKTEVQIWIHSLLSKLEQLRLVKRHAPLPSLAPVPASTLFSFPLTKTALQEFIASQPPPLHNHFYTQIDIDFRTGKERLCFSGSKWYQSKGNLLEWLENLRAKDLEFETLPLDFVYFVSEHNEFQLVPIDPAFYARLGNPFRLKPASSLTSHVHFRTIYDQLLLERFQAKYGVVPSLPADILIPALLPSAEYLPASCFQETDLTCCKLLGQGGFGEVYLTGFRRNTESNFIKVALKVTKSERVIKDKSFDGFVREYRLMRACSHPNVVKTYGYTCIQGRWALVLEYCPKSFALLIQPDSLSPKEKVEMLLGIARGLAFLHEKSIAHLDIKHHNVLVSDDGIPKLTDFGLSRKVSSSGITDKTGFTLHYTSIEQLRGSGISLKSDIWSFGNLIYFVVYAKGPYSDINLDTGNAHSYAARKGLLNELEINNRRPLFSDLEHSSLLYSRLHRIMQDCWALEPENRPSMNRVMHLLEKARYS